MVSGFSRLPESASLAPTPFTVAIPDSDLDELKLLLKLSKLSPATYENSHPTRKFGVTRKWLQEAKFEWETNFDWRKHESTMNQFPHFKVPLTHKDGTELNIHFMALFSQNKETKNLIASHGWPGSFLEYMPIFELLTTKYTPETLPYNIIVPSLPGYGFSSSPPLDGDFGLRDVAKLLDALMQGLGLAGYVAHGGDVGSFLSRILAAEYPNCLAAHILMCSISPPKNFDMSTLSPDEKQGLAQNAEFRSSGVAYGLLHATRPSTAGFVFSSSPLALLAWVGEKILAWTDEDPPIDDLLQSISLYWFTNTISTTLYPYRELFSTSREISHGNPALYVSKPLGYSSFPREIAPMPQAWVKTTGNLIFYHHHTSGGHFAALEKPKELLQDLDDYLNLVFPADPSKL